MSEKSDATETPELEYTVVQSAVCLGTWSVEAFDLEGEGELYMAVFTGPDARERAEEYAAFKNESDEERAVGRLGDALPALQAGFSTEHGAGLLVVGQNTLEEYLQAAALHFYRGGKREASA